ncbi:MAG: hypothetical protein H0V62_07800 [Gammaproteobacteria bacterium]|nr:hypothetical protein [Gammaproteobacteria bacterium]
METELDRSASQQADAQPQSGVSGKRNSLLARAARRINTGIRRNYDLARLYHQAQYLRGGLRRQQPVIIYQRGKVGSSSVFKSLKRSYTAGPVYHVHFIHEIEREIEQICRQVNLTPRTYFLRSGHLEISRYLQKEIRRGLKGKKWKVISLVRDPLKQRISSFFQVIDMLVPDFQARHRYGTLSIQELTDIFLDRYQQEGALADWFHQEMKPVFGIDVFGSEFPKSKGYEIYLGERADLLLIRLEDLDRCAGDAFGEFLGLSRFELEDDNVASTKDYASAYEEFKRAAILPESYVDVVYGSMSARHFYTEDERAVFKARCARTGGSPSPG